MGLTEHWSSRLPPHEPVKAGAAIGIGNYCEVCWLWDPFHCEGLFWLSGMWTKGFFFSTAPLHTVKSSCRNWYSSSMTPPQFPSPSASAVNTHATFNFQRNTNWIKSYFYYRAFRLLVTMCGLRNDGICRILGAAVVLDREQMAFKKKTKSY